MSSGDVSVPVRSHMHKARRSVAASGITVLADIPAARRRAMPCSVDAKYGDPEVVTADPPTSVRGMERIGKAMKFLGVVMAVLW